MVTIIIPVFNGQDVLERCVYSVTAQSYKKLEILLVDDGSEDSSLEICKRLALADNRIKVFHQPNKGVSAARNNGLAHSEGDFIMFVDSDDSIEENMLETLMKVQETYSADMVICGYKQIFESFQRIVSGVDFAAAPIGQLGDIFGKLYSKSLINSPWAKIYRKQLIKQGFDEDISLGEDILFNLNYLKGTVVIAGIKDAFYNYYISNSGTLHTNFPPDAEKLFLRIFSETNTYCHESLRTHDFDTLINLRLIINIYSLLDSLCENGRWRAEKIRMIIESKEIQIAARNAEKSCIRYRLFIFLIRGKHCRILLLFFRLINLYRRLRKSKKCV